MIKNEYKGYVLETKPNGEAMTTLVFDSKGNVVCATFSHLDKLSSVEKAQIKIDNILKK